MRSIRSVRSVVVPVVLGLLVVSCAADPSLTDEVAVEASDAATSGTDVGGADDPAESSAPESAAAEEETDAAAGDDAPSDEPEPEAPAVRPETVVSWLDTEFLLPSPWSLLATDGGAILLEHPSAAGPGGSVYVTLFAADGQLSAAQLMDVRPLLTASGEILETRELDAVFATGGPGLQAGASTSQVVSIYSDTGISVSISRDEGLLTEDAVATVLALLATIEPPAVTPSTERVGVAAAPPPAVDSGGPVIRFGESGWDSSAYPQTPPIPIPASFELYRAQDGCCIGGDQDREWDYWAPVDTGPLAQICRELIASLAGQGFNIVSGENCESWVFHAQREVISEQYQLRGISSDGSHLNVVVNDSGGPCLDTWEGQCPKLSIQLKLP